jgi:hypothetical protein
MDHNTIRRVFVEKTLGGNPDILPHTDKERILNKVTCFVDENPATFIHNMSEQSLDVLLEYILWDDQT